MEIDMNKFHVEEAKIQEIFVSKNRIYMISFLIIVSNAML